MSKWKYGVIFLAFIVTHLAHAEPKNVIVILADDLGWNDTTLFGNNQFLETPNLERLAEQGMLYTHSYTNNPLCSPNRASILTGQTPARHGSIQPLHHLDNVRLVADLPNSAPSNRMSIAPHTVTRLDTSIPTLSSVLKQHGYQTAHFGKWHLGASPYSPLEHGFDIDIPHFDGAGPTGGFLAPWDFAPNLQPQTRGEHIDERLATEAGNWMAEVSQDGPFYLNFWAFSVHSPFNADPDLVEHFVEKRSPYNIQRSVVYAAMVKHFDNAIGTLLDKLEELNLTEDTIIIFSSDNGGNMYSVLGNIRATNNFPLRGGKATDFDGGIRVPTIISWPGKTTPNSISSTPIQSVDFMPTLLEGLGIPLPSQSIIDGQDISNTFTGNSPDPRPLINFFPVNAVVPDWLPPSVTVQYDGWKLIRSFEYGQSERHLYYLYDLENDVGETTNLAAEYPSKVHELDLLIQQHLDEANAVVPIANPNYRSGTFDYSSIGNPAEHWRLPVVDANNAPPQITAYASEQRISEGQQTSIRFYVEDAGNNASVNYRQVTGPEVELQQTEPGTLLITGPTVYTDTIITLGFVANDSVNTSVKHVAVFIKPVESAPTVDVTSDTSSVEKGKSIELNITTADKNREPLTLAVSSSTVPESELTAPPLQGSYDVMIPADFTGDSVTLTFTVSDGTLQQSTDFTFSVSAPAAVVDNTSNNSSGGGTVRFWQLIVLLMIVWGRRTGISQRVVPGRLLSEK